tara:strand:+ start:348 stop:512 length:165 start_codon:yes stop_codon:yes gene_type:complete
VKGDRIKKNKETTKGLDWEIKEIFSESSLRNLIDEAEDSSLIKRFFKATSNLKS